MTRNILVLTFAISFGLSCSSAKNNSAKPGDEKAMDNPRNGNARSADEIIQQMDANRDGKLDLSEVKGPLLRDFSVIDIDKDGFLSKAESEKAPRPQRPNGPRH